MILHQRNHWRYYNYWRVIALKRGRVESFQRFVFGWAQRLDPPNSSQQIGLVCQTNVVSSTLLSGNVSRHNQPKHSSYLKGYTTVAAGRCYRRVLFHLRRTDHSVTEALTNRKSGIGAMRPITEGRSGTALVSDEILRRDEVRWAVEMTSCHWCTKNYDQS